MGKLKSKIEDNIKTDLVNLKCEVMKLTKLRYDRGKFNISWRRW